MTKFLISVLCLNRLKSTKACLESVDKHSNDYTLIITDNGSTDGTAEFLREWSSGKDHVIMVTNQENQGFIPPNNSAFEEAKVRGAKYFVALNNDCIVTQGWLSLLESAFKRDSMVALSGPAGGCNELNHNFHGHPGNRREYVEGSCLCVNVEIISKNWGYLFSPYLSFAYGEDSDLSLRVRERGYKIAHVRMTVPHNRGETSQKQEDLKRRCEVEQNNNHTELLRRWGYYMRHRRFDLPVVIRRRAAIGDVILTTPIIRALKLMNPHLHIYLDSDIRLVYSMCPLIKPDDPRRTPIKDAIMVDLDMTYENVKSTHIVDAYANATRLVFPGLPTVEKITMMNPSPHAMRWAKYTTSRWGEKVVAFHAGPTDWVGKNWNPQKWQDLCKSLVLDGWMVVAVGAGELPSEIVDCINLTKRTSFDQLVALLTHVHLFVGIDSAPMHVAQAVRCPTVGLFGVTRARYIMTDGSPHIGVESPEVIPGSGERHTSIGKTSVQCGPEVMDSITVGAVRDAIGRLVKL